LKGDRPEVFGLPSVIFLREKNKVGAIEALEVGRVRVKSMTEINNTLGSNRPSSFEGGAETVRA
jgi:hypothetical protein